MGLPMFTTMKNPWQSKGMNKERFEKAPRKDTVMNEDRSVVYMLNRMSVFFVRPPLHEFEPDRGMYIAFVPSCLEL
jgi:hypothetical protein